ncbi:MAG TPA: anti-sigma factor antagonist [Candidatus Marinimicrobia bacterium]|nr:anti-sigma factor antagonist [Candidatus Neomarinimicrobiota bacterium]
MGFIIVKKEKYAIIQINNRLDSLNSREFKEIVQELIKEFNYLIFDCSGMDFMDSTGLGALVSSLKYINQASGKLTIANLQSKPRIVFEITRAYKIFDVYNTVEEAEKALFVE